MKHIILWWIFILWLNWHFHQNWLVGLTKSWKLRFDLNTMSSLDGCGSRVSSSKLIFDWLKFNQVQQLRIWSDPYCSHKDIHFKWLNKDINYKLPIFLAYWSELNFEPLKSHCIIDKLHAIHTERGNYKNWIKSYRHWKCIAHAGLHQRYHLFSKQ